MVSGGQGSSTTASHDRFDEGHRPVCGGRGSASVLPCQASTSLVLLIRVAACTTYLHNHGNHLVHADITSFGPWEMERHLKATGPSRDEVRWTLWREGLRVLDSPSSAVRISNLIETGAWEGTDRRHAFIDDPRNRLFLEFVTCSPFHDLPHHGKRAGHDIVPERRASIMDVIRLEFEALGYTIDVNVRRG